MKNKIYVCALFYRDNFEIGGVFDNRLLAEKFCQDHLEWGYEIISEICMNPNEDDFKKDIECCWVHIGKEGNVLNIQGERSKPEGLKRYFFDDDGNMWAHCCFSRFESCVDVANDLRIGLIETGKWGVDEKE